MKSLKDILAEGVAVSSDFKLANSVDSQGRPTTRKVRAHRKTISPKKDDSEEKPDVLTSIQKFVGRQYAEGVNDPDYRGNHNNEFDELEDLASKSALTGSELNRHRVLTKKYGINSPKDMAKLPAMKRDAEAGYKERQNELNADLEKRNQQHLQDKLTDMEYAADPASFLKKRTQKEEKGSGESGEWKKIPIGVIDGPGGYDEAQKRIKDYESGKIDKNGKPIPPVVDKSRQAPKEKQTSNEEFVAEGSLEEASQDYEVKSAVWRRNKNFKLAPTDIKSHFVRADRSSRANKKASKDYEPGRHTWEIHPRGNNGVKEEFESVEEGRNDTPVPYGSLSNRPASATVAQTGPRKGMITKKHATRLKDRIKSALNKEEVELDEVSTDGYHKAAVKSRMDAAVKVMSSMGSDKEAKTKLDARNKGLKRLSDRTSTEMAKANSGPQKPTVSTHDGNDRGYGKGRYMGDSVELEGQMVEAQSPSMRMFKALQKIKQQREQDEARKKENEKRALTPVKEQTYDESNPKIKAALDKFRAHYTDKTLPAAPQDKKDDPKKYMSTDSGAAGNPDEYDADSFKPSNPAWKKRQAQEEQYAGSGQSKDMQRAVDAAHRDAERKMMRDIHGNSYQDKPVPEHDNSKVDISSDGNGGYSASVTKTPKAKPQAPTNEAKDDDEDYTKHHKLDPDSGVEADQHIHVQLKKAIDSTMKPYEVTFKNGKKHSVSSPVAKTIVTAVEKLKPEHRKAVHDELHKSYDSLMGVHKMIAGK